MTPPRLRRALLLGEFLFVLLPSMIVFGLMMVMIVDFLRIQRLARDHDSRMAAVDSLATRLRADITSADHVAWAKTEIGAGKLIVSNLMDGQVAYRFEPDRVTRVVGEIESDVWSATRLHFGCNYILGESGSLLLLMLEELPPPPNSALAPRKYARTFLLPPPSPATAEDSQ